MKAKTLVSYFILYNMILNNFFFNLNFVKIHLLNREIVFKNKIKKVKQINLII
jgi:hypothetical protein